jgi:hypothetical protein
MDIKVINAGNCVICGREIKIVARRSRGKLPNIFFCTRCEHRIIEYKINKEKKNTENEVDI